MHIKDAVVLRFQELCRERKIKYNDLAVRSGVTSSTVYSMMSPDRRDLSIITVKRLCDGLEITIPEFFDCELFENLEQEMK
ncbi:MAG: helix-turn-helix transcriptional regulator [Oscillospiraceae bacterium]|nr:helix-turn-helix transcriptional regulator [Oscillospiraceae bacterium]